MTPPQETTWPPPAEQIEFWLGSFVVVGVADHHASELPPAAKPRPVLRDEGKHTVGRALAFLANTVVPPSVLVAVAAGALLALFLLAFWATASVGTAAISAGIGALALAGAAVDVARGEAKARRAARPDRACSSGRPGQGQITVAADGTYLTVRAPGLEQQVRWAELVAAEDHGSDMVLRFQYGEALRLPRSPLLGPVWRAARRVAAERAAHEEQALSQMERGLSRPECDETAERGLSVVETEQR